MYNFLSYLSGIINNNKFPGAFFAILSAVIPVIIDYSLKFFSDKKQLQHQRMIFLTQHLHLINKEGSSPQEISALIYTITGKHFSKYSSLYFKFIIEECVNIVYHLSIVKYLSDFLRFNQQGKILPKEKNIINKIIIYSIISRIFDSITLISGLAVMWIIYFSIVHHIKNGEYIALIPLFIEVLFRFSSVVLDTYISKFCLLHKYLQEVNTGEDMEKISKKHNKFKYFFYKKFLQFGYRIALNKLKLPLPLKPKKSMILKLKILIRLFKK